MANKWNQARIQQYIDDMTQESLTLDYKAADALAKTDKEKKEVTKDVAAMANSAGGIIIYGMKEYKEREKKYLPEKIDPVDMRQFSKEWLEQVIMNIRPRIDGVTIFPVVIDNTPNGVVYVVEIPQSTTAHQSTDHRYYKRFNFMSEPMDDYEVKDVMARSQHPKIDLKFQIEITKHTLDKNAGYMGLGRLDKSGRSLPPVLETYVVYTLKTWARNVGTVYAQYVNARISVPYDLLRNRDNMRLSNKTIREVNLEEIYTYAQDNTVRDIIKNTGFGNTEKAAARYVPILPTMSQKWEDTILNDKFEEIDWGSSRIKWAVYCDNAQPNKNEISIVDIPIIDRRNEPDDDD